MLALPKGLVDRGEKPQATAVREVHEETGIVAKVVTKLTDIKYVYVRNWGDGERVFKIVSFYLLNYVSGEIDDVTPEMRIEVKRALWVPLAEASHQLMYSNERKVLRLAQDYLETHGVPPKDGLQIKKLRPRSNHKEGFRARLRLLIRVKIDQPLLCFCKGSNRALLQVA